MHLIKRFVLASRSPRRVRLLEQIGIRPEVVPAGIAETFDPHQSAAANAERLALEKARVVGAGFDDALILGADTIVLINGELLGKPENPDDARRMLGLLSGRTHTVCTAFALLDRPSQQAVTAHELTEVTFRDLPREEVENYLEGGTWRDKAGAYGIQDEYGAVFVSRINGCFYNVVGLPLARFFVSLQDFQRNVLHSRKDVHER